MKLPARLPASPPATLIRIKKKSQSAIFTPSDFIFPHDAIKAEATPNTETTLLADLDLALLKELGQHGSVRNLRQRRLDLYHLGWCGPDAEPKQAEESPERSSHP